MPADSPISCGRTFGESAKKSCKPASPRRMINEFQLSSNACVGARTFPSGISSNKTCKCGIEWDLCVPGLSCRFASERTLHFRWPPSANVGLDGVIYSDRISNLLMYFGAESAVSSENPLKSLGIRADFDSTRQRFEILAHLIASSRHPSIPTKENSIVI